MSGRISNGVVSLPLPNSNEVITIRDENNNSHLDPGEKIEMGSREISRLEAEIALRKWGINLRNPNLNLAYAGEHLDLVKRKFIDADQGDVTLLKVARGWLEHPEVAEGIALSQETFLQIRQRVLKHGAQYVERTLQNAENYAKSGYVPQSSMDISAEWQERLNSFLDGAQANALEEKREGVDIDIQAVKKRSSHIWEKRFELAVNDRLDQLEDIIRSRAPVTMEYRDAAEMAVFEARLLARDGKLDWQRFQQRASDLLMELAEVSYYGPSL